jgi:hypothetical protein
MTGFDKNVTMRFGALDVRGDWKVHNTLDFNDTNVLDDNTDLDTSSKCSRK